MFPYIDGLYVTKLVMYKICSPVMYQLRVRTAGASYSSFQTGRRL